MRELRCWHLTTPPTPRLVHPGVQSRSRRQLRLPLHVPRLPRPRGPGGLYSVTATAKPFLLRGFGDPRTPLTSSSGELSDRSLWISVNILLMDAIGAHKPHGECFQRSCASVRSKPLLCFHARDFSLTAILR
ncbi:hypothetical protein AB1Y20_023058 [Prymnesium parvum]|uniref:Uncharacterized protein n=1 Tax=Prymnesium parvum TaxID=97485 RepID=A0AB34JDR5_PRYPA